MGLVQSLMFFMLTMIVVVESSFAKNDAMFGLGYRRLRACNARIGNCMNESEEMMLDSQASRRILAQQRGGYISYDAMQKNNAPCSKRGSSYYDCASHQKVNPYSRSCSTVTKCARGTR